jgi:hypothetical protein
MTTQLYRFLDVGDPLLPGDELYTSSGWDKRAARGGPVRLAGCWRRPVPDHTLGTLRYVKKLEKAVKQQAQEIKNLRGRRPLVVTENRIQSCAVKLANGELKEFFPAKEDSKLVEDARAAVASCLAKWRAPYIADQHRPFYKGTEGYTLLREGDVPQPGDEYAIIQSQYNPYRGTAVPCGLVWSELQDKHGSFVVGRERGMTWRRPKLPTPMYRLLGTSEVIARGDEKRLTLVPNKRVNEWSDCTSSVGYCKGSIFGALWEVRRKL